MREYAAAGVFSLDQTRIWYVYRCIATDFIHIDLDSCIGSGMRRTEMLLNRTAPVDRPSAACQTADFIVNIVRNYWTELLFIARPKSIRAANWIALRLPVPHNYCQSAICNKSEIRSIFGARCGKYCAVKLKLVLVMAVAAAAVVVIAVVVEWNAVRNSRMPNTGFVN